jgi:hypothetical protein
MDRMLFGKTTARCADGELGVLEVFLQFLVASTSVVTGAVTAETLNQVQWTTESVTYGKTRFLKHVVFVSKQSAISSPLPW